MGWKQLADTFFEILRKSGHPHADRAHLSVNYRTDGAVLSQFETFELGDWPTSVGMVHFTEAQAYEWASGIVERSQLALENGSLLRFGRVRD